MRKGGGGGAPILPAFLPDSSTGDGARADGGGHHRQRQALPTEEGSTAAREAEEKSRWLEREAGSGAGE